MEVRPYDPCGKFKITNTALPAKDWPRFWLSKFCTVLLTDILNARIFNWSKIRPVPCKRSVSLHLDLVPRNFLLQLKALITILSIFSQNALRTLLAVKHSILSESDGVKIWLGCLKKTPEKISQISSTKSSLICCNTSTCLNMVSLN